MSQLENLPPDLRAVLSLLLRQHKRYADVAALLDIEEHAVHDRAHAALALLAPREARELTAPQREQLGEYLLGQQDPAAESRTRAYLESSGAGRAWARALAGQLSSLTTGALPHIPAGPGPASAARSSTRQSSPPAATADSPQPAGSAGPAQPAGPAGPAKPAGPAEQQPSSSRVGGAVILGALAAIVIVAVLLIVGIGGGGGSHTTKNASTATAPGKTRASSGTSTSASTSTDTTTGSSGTTGAGSSGTGASATSHGKALPLTPPDTATSKAVGVAYVLSQKGQRAFYVFAKGLPALPSDAFYAVWLEGATGAAAYPLGSLPAQGTSGLVEGGGPLPSNAGSYSRIIITSETSHHPSHPGPTALGGVFTAG